MQTKPLLPWIFGLGLALAASAVWFRQQDARVAQPPTSRSVAAVREPTDQEATLRAEVAAAPNALTPRWKLADYYQKTGKVEQTMAELRAILSLSPNEKAAHLGLANGYLYLKQFTRAEESYRSVLRKWAKEAEAWQGLAASLYHQQRYLEALNAARRAVALQPKDPNNAYMLATSALEYASQYPDDTLRARELVLAKTEFEKILKRWPDNGDVHYRLGRTCMALNQGNAAIGHLRRARELSPPRPDLFKDLIRAYRRLGNHVAALAVVEEALQRFPDDGALYDFRGQLLQDNSEAEAPRQALEAFRQAVRLRPDYPLFWERLGTAHLRVNEVREAREAFETAARLDTNRAFPYQQLATVYTRLGDPARARQASQTATQMISNEQQLRRLISLSKINPNNVALRLVLADRYRELGIPGAARDEYLAILALQPGNGNAKRGLAALKRAGGGTRGQEPVANG